MTVIDDFEEDEELDLASPEMRAAGRWNSAGVPGERSKDFKSALRRLVRMLGPMWVILIVVAAIAVLSATLNRSSCSTSTRYSTPPRGACRW